MAELVTDCPRCNARSIAFDVSAHHVNLAKEDAEDLLAFTLSLLDRMYTEPERVQLAQKRRDARRADQKK